MLTGPISGSVCWQALQHAPDKATTQPTTDWSKVLSWKKWGKVLKKVDLQSWHVLSWKKWEKSTKKSRFTQKSWQALQHAPDKAIL